jgi:pimeloyl-ACP methyl ester carboxylesterase
MREDLDQQLNTAIQRAAAQCGTLVDRPGVCTEKLSFANRARKFGYRSRMGIVRCTWALIACLLAACGGSYGDHHNDVVFTRYSPLSRNAEIARRMLPPLTYRRIEETIQAGQTKLAEQAIDLAHEKYDLYVPPGPPPAAGYGLVVFIAPWESPTRPEKWRAALDRHGLIFVSAQGSGNTQNILDRRVPLALLGYENVKAQYPIDDKRVYVWGLSGGSRTAEMVALAYPDVFRGVILNAGADPIDGQDGMYKPPAELFHQFQRRRVVYITGDLDAGPLVQDDVSQASMRAACVLDVQVDTAHGLGHESLDAVILDRVLDTLEAPHAIDEAALAACNARVERDIAAQIADARAAVARGDRDGARAKLKAIEARYAGLAARELLEVDAQLQR